MQHGAAFLHSAIVPAPDDFAPRHDHRSDGNAAFAEPLFRFGDGRREEWIGRHAVAARIASYSNTFGPRGASCAIVTIARSTVAAFMGRKCRSLPIIIASHTHATSNAICPPRRTP